MLMLIHFRCWMEDMKKSLKEKCRKRALIKKFSRWKSRKIDSLKSVKENFLQKLPIFFLFLFLIKLVSIRVYLIRVDDDDNPFFVYNTEQSSPTRALSSYYSQSLSWIFCFASLLITCVFVFYAKYSPLCYTVVAAVHLVIGLDIFISYFPGT